MENNQNDNALQAQMPRKNQVDESVKYLEILHALKEPFRQKGCKTELGAYLQWLTGKVEFYESNLKAWESIQQGTVVWNAQVYVNRKKDEAVNFYNQATERIRREETRHAAEVASYESRIAQLVSRLDSLQVEVNKTEETVELARLGFYDYSNPAESASDLKDKLMMLKMRIKELVRGRHAIKYVNNGFTFNNSVAEGNKFVKDFADLMLTAYNQEVENAIVKMEKTRTISTAIDRVNKASEKVEKLGTMMSMEILDEYHNLRLEEIKLGFEFKMRQEQEKQEEMDRRAEMRELERARKEHEKNLEKVHKERDHIANIIAQIPQDDPQMAQYQERLQVLAEAEEKSNASIANISAGYVYVISNIGSFGEEIVKIGLTRRQNPQDRVDELGSASVPFRFDVHTLHFAHDAVRLERDLHKKFAHRAVNRVNSRKEFFRATPAEVRDAMLQLSPMGTTLTFTEYAEAPEYKMSVIST